MTYAPIVLFTYNRPWHTRQTIEALQKNELSINSELFVFSDGAKDDLSAKKVKEVREYLKTVNGFKKITIIEREKNWGLAENIIDGVTKIVNEYGKIIVLEDDLVTSPYFLRFMNEALEFYKDEKKVMSLSGYTYPFNLSKGYMYDVFCFYRTSSWGWASWKDRWESVDFDIKDYCVLLKDKVLQNKLRRGGNDLVEMLKMQMEGKISSWAVRFAYSAAKQDRVCVYPIKSLIRNIGHDNSGIHCGKSDKWEVEVDNNFYPKNLLKELYVDKVINKALKPKFNINYFRRFLSKVKSNIKKVLCYVRKNSA
mgnify:CR=1 FL=1